MTIRDVVLVWERLDDVCVLLSGIDHSIPINHPRSNEFRHMLPTEENPGRSGILVRVETRG